MFLFDCAEISASLKETPSFTAGKELFNAANYIASRDLFLKALDEIVKNRTDESENLLIAIHYYLGQVYFNLGDHEQAISHFSQHLRKTHECEAVLEGLGVLAMNGGEIEKAEGFLKRALRVNPSSLTIRNNLGLFELAQEKYGAAEKYFSTILVTNPFNSQANYGMAICYDKQGKSGKEIIAFYKKALKNSYQEEEKLLSDMHMSICCFIKQDNKQAKKILGFYEKILDGLENDPAKSNMLPIIRNELISLGELFYTEGKLENAKGFYLKALSLNPKDTTALTQLGMIFSQTGDKNKGRLYFNEVIKASHSEDAQSQADAWYNRGYSQEDSKPFHAKGAYDIASKLAPDDKVIQEGSEKNIRNIQRDVCNKWRNFIQERKDASVQKELGRC